MTFGKYRGQSFKWLLENDVGWTAWLLAHYIVVGEKDPLMKWQKQTAGPCEGVSLRNGSLFETPNTAPNLHNKRHILRSKLNKLKPLVITYRQ
ncbi:hypothetical protein DPMN_136843 [Dreissena polymorpha]|uniref:Uncharacterized protein n=1 Tax=Dreissena polymorpha TaxID=45954 RepID=A0A9D4G6P0_DREPO|nr:hypothetical protein DPMN_136843 [Dreissena polymorpha]